jgi:hypothetical protein
MTDIFISDLTIFNRHDFVLKFVGWTSRFADYPKGSVNLSWLERAAPISWIESSQLFLGHACQNEMVLTGWRGFMKCPLCKWGQRPQYYYDSAIAIPSGVEENLLYVAPGLITHYVRDHGYFPPIEFLDAVKSFDTEKTLSLGRITKYGITFPKTPEGERYEALDKEDTEKYLGFKVGERDR